MKWNCSGYIVLFASLLLFMGCRNEMDESAQLRIRLALPDREQSAPQPRRLPGDPGTTEVFELPKYAYILVMKDHGDGTWSVWRREERRLAASDWTRTRYYGSGSTREDSIFTYDKDIQFLLNGERLKGRVYAVCSNKKLSFNTAFGDVSNLTQVLDWKFDCSPDSIQKNLQNIYSTPFNYQRYGRYYCAFDCSSGTVFPLDMLLYHVAAKVDLTWNVDEQVRYDKVTPSNGVRLTYMEARRLFNGQAYCFKPMRNELADLPTSGYDIPDLVANGDEGLWWEGRTYFYTIPYIVTGEPDYFPLQMVLCTNGVAKADGYKLTLKQPMDTSDIFVPWLRGNINITKALENKEETKTID